MATSFFLTTVFVLMLIHEREYHVYMSKEKVKVIKEGGGNAVYSLGAIGAVVFYIQQADGFFNIILAFLKGLVWPAFLVYDALKALG